MEWIYNSNAIEGSTITLRETQLILETGLTIGGKSLREHFEVIDHKDAIDYVEALGQQDIPLSAFHVRQIHKLVLSRIDDENAGSTDAPRCASLARTTFRPNPGRFHSACKTGKAG